MISIRPSTFDLRRFGLLPAVAGLLFSVLGFTGCSHYRLGTGAERKFRTLYVAPVSVETMLPQAQAVVGTAIRETFDRDGRVRLAAHSAEADAVLTIALIGYDREVATVRADDTGLARRFDISLRARCALTLRDGRTALFDQRVFTAKRGVFTDSGQQQSEYENLPLLATELARQLLSASLDTW